MITAAEWHEKYPEARTARSATVLGSFEEFRSPLDGSMISDRRQLANHNKKHGVTNVADYSPQYFADAKQRMAKETVGDTPQQDRDREKALVNNLRKAGVKV